jgi:hypothetical protein
VLTPFHAISLCCRRTLINKGSAFQASSPKLTGSATSCVDPFFWAFDVEWRVYLMDSE